MSVCPSGIYKTKADLTAYDCLQYIRAWLFQFVMFVVKEIRTVEAMFALRVLRDELFGFIRDNHRVQQGILFQYRDFGFTFAP